ncbi:MAG: acyl transferase [Croceitalea sp.]|nr:acyl transferase [Croceitalea sp.]
MHFEHKTIFNITNTTEFETSAIQLFHFQYINNPVYREFCNRLKIDTAAVKDVNQIPYLPIEFFKTKRVVSGQNSPQVVFSSSGTTGSTSSKHYVTDITLYENSYRKTFELFYGTITDYCVLALLPSYLERSGSSLIYMVNDLIFKSNHPDSGFYLDNLVALKSKIEQQEKRGQKTLLIGVSFALLDFVESFDLSLRHTIVMETGGMKGRRKELIRNELHQLLNKAFGTKTIHSEYGMTELLSQAYSLGEGIFECPPWMKVTTRDTEDPLSPQELGKTGGINVIDLANVYSCAFIATQDLGKVHYDGSFEVLGRFDHSDIRGCNLMAL